MKTLFLFCNQKTTPTSTRDNKPYKINNLISKIELAQFKLQVG